MKRVLGVIGSPRKKGNTHILVEKILEGAKDKGAAVNSLFLKDLNINECDGCHTCWKGKECSKKDDMNNIYLKIIESDIIIFGTPVYWYGPTALMKAFIDRFVYFNSPDNREKIINKSVIVVVPYEEESYETARPLINMFEKSFDYLQLRLVRKIIVPGVGTKGEVLNKHKYLEEAYKCGINLI